MAGVYIHIPYCKQACHYCDFHFSTSLKSSEQMVRAIIKEVELRKDYLHGETVETIYFGGGTPSMLSPDDLSYIMDAIHRWNDVSPSAEITLEANPDDLTKDRIQWIRQSAINRLSIGIQSFRDQDLKWMNRAHEAADAEYVVKSAQDAGLHNITVDLIYSIPGLEMKDWLSNIHQAIALEVPHISAYGLTIEPGTFFGHQLKQGKFSEMPSTESSLQFLALNRELTSNGFLHYEISNFCKPGHESKHNTAYWKGKSYLGIGPSAHSFNGVERSWNIRNNAVYIREIESGRQPSDSEILDNRTQYNEYVMTGLRTMWGIDLLEIQRRFEIDLLKQYDAYVQDLMSQGKMIQQENRLILTLQGMLTADGIASELFIL